MGMQRRDNEALRRAPSLGAQTISGGAMMDPLMLVVLMVSGCLVVWVLAD